MTDSVARLAARAAADPAFLAFALAEFATAEGLSDATLAARLGVTPEALSAVQLCRTPRADPEGFRADVDRIAQVFGVDRAALVSVARHGQAVAAMRAAGEAVADGSLLAARDRAGP